MDRLAKVQAHKRLSIHLLKDAYASNQLAKDAADALYGKVMQAMSTPSRNNISSETSERIFFPASNMVPLVSCGILSGSHAGIAYITSKHLLIFTHFIPLIGGEKMFAFNLKDIHLQIQASAMGLPPGLVVEKRAVENHSNDESKIAFIPKIGSQRFMTILEIISTIMEENPDTLKFTARGGILYMHEDQNVSEEVETNDSEFDETQI